MNGLPQILEQASRFVEQHLPPEVSEPVVPAAILLASGGVLIAVLGAKLIRPALTAGLGLAGAIAAGRIAYGMDLPVPITAIIGGLIAGGLGFVLYRLWVGVGAAAVLACAALSVFGYLRILPEIETFEPTGVAAGVGDAADQFAVLAPDEQREYLERAPEEWARQLWTHLTSRQPSVGRKLSAIAGAAALLGLLMGIILTRPTVILYTSAIGTSLVVVGLAVVAARMAPELYRSALANQPAIGGAAAGLLLASLVLQARLYRRPPAPPPSQPASQPGR